MKKLKLFENFNTSIKWVEVIKDDYQTYPKEGYPVLVSDGDNYDVAWYLMSGEYKWVKSDLIKDDLVDFDQFIVKKWTYFE